jgi:hypothetical protein
MTTTTSREAHLDLRHQPRTTLEDARWGRIAAAGGVAFVVLNVAGTFAPGAPPASDASAAKVAAYFRDHAGAIKAQQLVGGLGIVALYWWFGALWRVLNRAEGERPRLTIVAAVSLATGLAIAMISGAITATAALRVDNSDAILRLLWTFSLVGFATVGFALATFLIAACTVIFRTQVTPPWTAYLGWVAAFAFLVSSAGTVSDSSVINSFGLVAFLLWCAWILAISAFMWRGTATDLA